MGAVIILEINIRDNDKRQTLTDCPLGLKFDLTEQVVMKFTIFPRASHYVKLKQKS